MSSVPASSMVAVPSASSSPGSAAEPSGPAPLLSSQASLYLYTFLVTLVLLLTVSGAIVFRSLILRRRHRRMVAEAIRNGTYVPPAARAKRQRLGEKPTLYDAFLDFDGEASPASSRKFMALSKLESETRWDDILPVSVQFVQPNQSTQSAAEQNSSTSMLRPPRTWRERLASMPSVSTLFGFPTSSRAPTSTSPISATSTSPAHITAGKTWAASDARIAVIIAMPQPPMHKAPPAATRPPSVSPSPPGLATRLLLPGEDGDDADTLPHLEIGIVDVWLEEWKEVDAQDSAGPSRTRS